MSNETCIFCKIVSGAIPCAKVYEDDVVLAFNDLHPQAPTHVLIIPKVHLASLNEAGAAQTQTLGCLLTAAGQIAHAVGFAEAGYRTVINTGADGGQTVFHLHVHLLAGRPLNWPPG